MNITAHLAGKRIEAFLTDGRQLIVRTTDGHEARIGWVDGEPVLLGIDVRILVRMPSLTGEARL